MDLNQYGGGCRCLLRLRENAGEPGLSDGLLISQFISRYPEWQDRPGETDAFTLCDLAKELKLAGKVEVFRDYNRILQEHRAGQSILVLTERAPEQTKEPLAVQHHVLLVVAMDETHFTVWCPYPSGQSDQLPKAARSWWDEWLAIGLVLYRP